MSQSNFTVQYRDKAGKGPNRRLQQQGFVPGIVYGKETPVKVSMKGNKAEQFISSLKGSKKPFDLTIEKDGKTDNRTVIVQEYQVGNWNGKLQHVDFREVDKDTKLKMDIAVLPVGTSNAQKLGGILQQVRRHITIECTVENIPEKIEVDVTELNFGESLHVLDFEYPKGVTPLVTGRNFTLFTVAGAAKGGTEEEEEGAEEAAAE